MPAEARCLRAQAAQSLQSLHEPVRATVVHLHPAITDEPENRSVDALDVRTALDVYPAVAEFLSPPCAPELS